MNTVLSLLIIFAVVGISVFYQATRGVEGQQRTFSVTGEAEVATVPDLATLSFSVVTEGIDSEKIQEENNKKINSVIVFVKGHDVEKEDVQTSGYNLNPKYNYDRQTGVSNIIGYTLSQNVTVKVRDLESVSAIVGGLPALGVNQISSPQFSIEDQDAAMEEARTEAIENAKEKAKSLAKKTGLRLGDVINVTESGGRYDYPMYYGGAGVDGDIMMETKAMSAPTIEPGTQDVRVYVTLTYEVK